MVQVMVSAVSGSALVAPPRLSSRTVVFTNGPCLTLKSTIAEMLGKVLDVRVLATFQYGEVLTNGVLDGAKRLDRYKCLGADAKLLLGAAHSVILDGSFGDHSRRLYVYRLARRFGLRVIAIRTSCDDFDIICARARRRTDDPTSPDHEVDERYFALTRDEVREHPIEEDTEFWELGVKIIEVHTGRRPRVACQPGASRDAKMIADVLRASGLLKTARAYAPRAGRSLARVSLPW